MKKGISLSIGFVTIVLGALFCVGIQGSLAALLPTSSSIQNQAPAFTAGPSDGGSSVATPTTAGNNVTFTATATDANGEQYYLAICKTNAIGAGDNVAPTCPGGSWAISTATNTGVGASVTYLTSTPDATANVWYAFVCDKVVGGGSCSSTSQGSGDVGSPFVVNHIPTQSTPSTRAHAFLDANSVGYWQFEDGTGTTSFVDKTSNHNGTCSGGACPTWTQEGAIGGGVRFDGVNDTVSLGNDIFTNAQLASGSVSLWVYVNSIASDFLPINLEGVVWVGQATGLCPAGNWCANLNSVNNSFMNGGSIATGAWTNVVVTWDGSTHRIFINGTQTNSQSRGSPNFDFFSRGNAIGSLFDGTSYFTNGIIDEVHIYSRALSAIEIKNLYSSDSYAYDLHDLGVGARTLVDLDSDALVCSVDWRKNGTSAAVLNMSFNKNVTATTAGAVLDYSSYANNGTLGGGNATFVPTWQNAATCGNNSGGCYNFDGTNDFIDTNDASFDFIDGINPFSVEAWIHPDAVTGERIVMAKHAVGQSGWWLNIRNDTKLELASQGNWNNAGVSTTSLSPGNWYHVVGTYDGSNARLYVNGSYEAISPTTLSNVVSNYNLTIGSQTGSIFFDGIIDEPRVYNRTLSATEISNHYNAGKPNFQNFNNAETAIGDLWSSNLTCADTYGVESSASTSNSVEILGFTADVSDGGSSATTPTNVGSNVTFTGTYNAPSARLWYLAVCKTNAVTAGNDAAPTCDGGSWAISATTADATQATVAYTTLVGDAESNPWYAFACDKVASVASCSPMTQGSGNNGSPFVVNHRPSYSAYSATDATGGTIEPGDTVKFSATTADADVGDTVALYVCPSGNTFNGSACSGTEICHVAATAPGAVSCSSATLAPIPTAHGSTNVEIFVVDSHAFVGNGASTQSYSVTDVAPTITSSNQYSTTAITLAAGTSTAKSYTVVVSDNNGGSDLVSTGAVLYDSAAISLASGTCSASDANCYSGVSCTPGVPSGVNLTYTCDFTVWFNANASSSWKMHANPADGQGAVTNLTDSNAIAVGALQAISIPETAIAYGALTLGTTSSGVAIALQNVGNQVLDVLIQGSDMARTGGGATISLAQQKWHNTSSVFDYSTTGNTLVSSAAGATTKAAGCADRNVAVRAAHASGVGSDENLYWKLQMPSAQMAGTYTGTNTLAAAASTQCADGE